MKHRSNIDLPQKVLPWQFESPVALEMKVPFILGCYGGYSRRTLGRFARGLFAPAISSLVFALLFFFCASASAQPISLSTSVAPKSGTLEDTFIFSVSVKGATGKRPTLSGGTDWSVNYIGPSTQVSIINGRITTSATYSYAMVAHKEGVLGTPEATLDADGQKYSAPPIQVSVSAAAQPGTPSDSTSAVTLKQSLSKTSAYRGEQIVHKLVLTSNASLRDPRFEDLPFDGFWQESIGNIESARHTVRGKPQVSLSQRKALFALRAGEILLPRRSVTVQILDRSRAHSLGLPGIFGSDDVDDFLGFSSYRTVTPRSNELTLEVKELPPRPSNYADWGVSSPLVGDTELKMLYDPSTLKVGESKAVSLEITSIGNLNPLRRAPLEDTPSYRVYQESPTSESFENNAQIISKRRIRLSIVPLVPGPIRVPALLLGYFDPEDGTYREARSHEVVFNVTGAALTNSAPQPTAEPTQSVQPIETPLPTATPLAPSLAYHEPGMWERFRDSVSIGYVLMLLVGAALLAAIVYAIVLGIRARMAAKLRRRTLDQADSVERLREAFLHMTEARIQHPGAARSLDDTRHALASATSISAEVRFAVAELIDDFEELLYSGTPVTSAQTAQLKEKIQKLVEGW